MEALRDDPELCGERAVPGFTPGSAWVDLAFSGGGVPLLLSCRWQSWGRVWVKC